MHSNVTFGKSDSPISYSSVGLVIQRRIRYMAFLQETNLPLKGQEKVELILSFFDVGCGDKLYGNS